MRIPTVTTLRELLRMFTVTQLAIYLMCHLPSSHNKFSTKSGVSNRPIPFLVLWLRYEHNANLATLTPCASDFRVAHRREVFSDYYPIPQTFRHYTYLGR